MRNHVQVAVIGGGVVGASVLYHLTKAGWKDVLLIERAELTSGSTWHAAGGMHTVNGDPNVAKLQQYTIELYKEIEAISGVSCGVHITGGLMLAGTPERVDWLRMAVARGRYLGMDLQLISAAEAKKLYPLLDEKHFLGAIYDPIEGHVDPYGVTHAYAKSAQLAGAEIVRQNRVIDTRQRADGTWDVITEKGTVHAEHVVNAGGLWAREVGRFVGLELPILAMEHQYFITEDLPELKGQQELLHVIDFEAEIYMRQERQGMLLGTYERAGVPWSPKTTPWDFGQDLLPNDLERIAPSVTVAFEHFPRLESAGIKKVVNGPFTFAPDGNPLVGPIKGLKNYWVACGVMAGFSQGGGVGLSLANWMVEGDPGADIWAMDVARYGDWANRPYTNAKVRENYSRRFRIRFPNEELEAARPLRTTPIYERLQAENAVFGDYCTLEHPLWFAPQGHARAGRRDLPSLECASARGRGMPRSARVLRPDRDLQLRQVRNHGPGCRRLAVEDHGLQGARRRPHRAVAHAQRPWPADRRLHAVPRCGRAISSWSARMRPKSFTCAGSSSTCRRPACRVRPCAMEYLGLVGGRARSRARCCRSSSITTCRPRRSRSCRSRRWTSAWSRRSSAASRSRARLGYEMWVTSEYLRALYDLLHAAGKAHGLRYFGGRALNSLRLEKSFGNWAREFRPDLRAVRGGPRPLRASRQAGLHRQGRRGRREGEWWGAQAHHAGRRREGCGCDRRRADLARRQGRRLGHLGWLWPHGRQVDRARLRRQRGGGGDGRVCRRTDG